MKAPLNCNDGGIRCLALIEGARYDGATSLMGVEQGTTLLFDENQPGEDSALVSGQQHPDLFDEPLTEYAPAKVFHTEAYRCALF